MSSIFSSRPPVFGGTVRNLFEPRPILGHTDLDRAKPIVDRLAVCSVFRLDGLNVRPRCC